MNKSLVVQPFKDERESHEIFGSGWQKSITLDQDSTLDEKFNELILAMHSMIDIMRTMERWMM